MGRSEHWTGRLRNCGAEATSLSPTIAFASNADRQSVEIRAIVIEDRLVIVGQEIGGVPRPSGSNRVASSLSGSDRLERATPIARHCAIVSRPAVAGVHARAFRAVAVCGTAVRSRVEGTRTGNAPGTCRASSPAS